MIDNSLKKALLTGLGVAALSIGVSSMAQAQKPKTVSLTIDNHQLQLETNANSISELLKNVGYTYQENNSRINHSLDDKITNNMAIEIDTQKNVTFSNGGTVLNVKTYAANVGEFLKEKNVTVDNDDVVSPSLTKEITEGDRITVDFYNISTYKKTEKIAFKNENKESFDLAYGTSKVTTKGLDGQKEVTYKKIVKNGKLVSDSASSEKVIKAATNQVTLVGTKQVVVTEKDFETVTRKNSSMYTDEENIITEGVTGKETYVFKNNGKTKTLVSKTVTDPVTQVVEVGTKERPVASAATSSAALYSLSDLQYHGVIYWGGYKYTYYSQSVLPGGGLSIPGRHVNASGYVSDGDGYIVIASSLPKGTVVPTPFGYMGKVYDAGTYGNHLDVYTQ